MSYWLKMNPREQAAVLIAAACIALWLCWQLVVSPLNSAIDGRQAAVLSSQQASLRVQSLAEELAALRAAGIVGQANTTSLAQIVDRSVRGSTLQMSGFQPGRDNDATVRFERANFNALLEWMHQLESAGKARVSELSVQSGTDAGIVSATVKLAGN